MEQYREVPSLYVNSVDCVAHQCAIDPRYSKRPFSGAIGVMVIGFSLLQLQVVEFLLKKSRGSVTRHRCACWFCGRLSAVWGPPTVAYLTVMDVEKKEHIRTQGVIMALVHWP